MLNETIPRERVVDGDQHRLALRHQQCHDQFHQDQAEVPRRSTVVAWNDRTRGATTGLEVYGDSAYGSGEARAAYSDGGPDAAIKPKPLRPSRARRAHPGRLHHQRG